MASVLDSTTADKAVTLSDDMALCGCQNVRPAADFERCCINTLKLPRVLDLNFILTSQFIAMFTEESFCFFVFFYVFLFFFAKGKLTVTIVCYFQCLTLHVLSNLKSLETYYRIYLDELKC